jgi:cytochrome P450
VFGQGIQFCLGTALARLKTRIAVSTLLEEVRLFRTADIEYEPIQRTVVYGLDSVPIQYE